MDCKNCTITLGYDKPTATGNGNSSLKESDKSHPVAKRSYGAPEQTDALEGCVWLAKVTGDYAALASNCH